MKDLETSSLVFVILREFLADLRQEFGRGDNKTIKVAELKKVK